MKFLIYCILFCFMLAGFGAIIASPFYAIWISVWLGIQLLGTGICGVLAVVAVHKFIELISDLINDSTKEALSEYVKENPEKVSKFQERLEEAMRKQAEQQGK